MASAVEAVRPHVRASNAKLAAAFDYALHGINSDGTFAELYLRYFPVSFF